MEHLSTTGQSIFHRLGLVAKAATILVVFRGPDVDTGDGWAALGLVPTLKWPLQLVFSPAIVAKYNSLLQFFLRVNRVQWRLQHTWMLGQKGSAEERSVAVLPRVWSLRSRMSFMVDNLQTYLKIDVLEAQYKIMLDAAHAIQDFDSLRRAHSEYLNQLLVQTFRNGAPIRRTVADIFGLCMAFCELMERGGPAKDPTGFKELDRIEVAFARQSTFLFKVLSSVSGKQYLRQLLLRIDFNQHFSTPGVKGAATTTASSASAAGGGSVQAPTRTAWPASSAVGDGRSEY
eukprot:gene17706-22438_t